VGLVHLKDGGNQTNRVSRTIAKERSLIARQRRANCVGQLIQITPIGKHFREVENGSPQVERIQVVDRDPVWNEGVKSARKFVFHVEEDKSRPTHMDAEQLEQTGQHDVDQRRFPAAGKAEENYGLIQYFEWNSDDPKQYS